MLLLLDYEQQDINALDLLKELRQVSRLDLPIILVTGQGDEVLPQALRLGASDYVVQNLGYLSWPPRTVGKRLPPHAAPARTGCTARQAKSDSAAWLKTCWI